MKHFICELIDCSQFIGIYGDDLESVERYIAKRFDTTHKELYRMMRNLFKELNKEDQIRLLRNIHHDYMTCTKNGKEKLQSRSKCYQEPSSWDEFFGWDIAIYFHGSIRYLRVDAFLSQFGLKDYFELMLKSSQIPVKGFDVFEKKYISLKYKEFCEIAGFVIVLFASNLIKELKAVR